MSVSYFLMRTFLMLQKNTKIRRGVFYCSERLLGFWMLRLNVLARLSRVRAILVFCSSIKPHCEKAGGLIPEQPYEQAFETPSLFDVAPSAHAVSTCYPNPRSSLSRVQIRLVVPSLFVVYDLSELNKKAIVLLICSRTIPVFRI